MKIFAAILTVLFIPMKAVASEHDASGKMAQSPVIRLSEPVAVTASEEVFGAPFPASKHAMTLTELVNNSEQHLGSEVVVNTEIVKVCQKKGCFFIAREGDAVARVTFLDYGFFIPTDAGGKRVTLAGTFSRQTLTDNQAEHMASDLGEPVSVTDPLQYAIVASSVRIPKS
jgi:hypothetical protein